MVNLLLLTGPVFTIEIYDRVLATRSMPTLAALAAFAVFLFGVLGLFDLARSVALARLAAGLASRGPAAGGGPAAGDPLTGGADRPDGEGRGARTAWSLLLSPSASRLLDLPFAPLFVAALFVLHPLLGLAAGAGAVLLLATAAGPAWRAAGKGADAGQAQPWQPADEGRPPAGPPGPAIEAEVCLLVLRRTLGFWIQTAVLALGAYLAILDRISVGSIVAASILSERALGPVGHLAAIAPEALAGLARRPRPGTRPRPAPAAMPPDGTRGLELHRPGPATAAGPLAIAPGTAVAVLGASGSGKSRLLDMMAAGAPDCAATLGGVRLSALPETDRLRRIGHVAQGPFLSSGPGQAAARAAARAALLTAADLADALGRFGLAAPDARAGPLPAGTAQRLRLACAFAGRPSLILLDEPEAHLDSAGLSLLCRAVAGAAAGGAVILVASHRPEAIAACTHVLALDGGRQRAFGPRESVLSWARAARTSAAGAAR
ncbi:MAG: ATP-binding cassette domain-containing protein [Pseudomonadota bacterium]